MACNLEVLLDLWLPLDLQVEIVATTAFVQLQLEQQLGAFLEAGLLQWVLHGATFEANSEVAFMRLAGPASAGSSWLAPSFGVEVRVLGLGGLSSWISTAVSFQK